MELIIKNDSNVKLVIYKDEIVISTVVGDGEKSSSVIQKVDGISAKVGI
ncbi:MAG: hypothetical protein J6D33_04980 [Turicibacter sp.]|nr:hypothetical protein [Turicibacter sp.]